MKTEEVSYSNFEDLFRITVRYEIPFFQRGYAWEPRQWKKLFEDIENGIIDNIIDNDFENEEHFFGPMVVLEKTGGPISLKRFLIIDGQQRITTIYLILGILKKLFNSKANLSADAEKYSTQINTLIENDTSSEDDYIKLKVFSSKGDRYPTFKAIFGVNPNSEFLSEDQILYNPDDNKIDAFVRFANRKLKKYDVPTLWNIYQAIVKSLKIFWIPLSDKDDAQTIFESLNDAGMPLSSAELLCNYIFKPLVNEKTNEHEKLHNEKWLKARRNVGESNFEEYLRTLFSIGESKRVGKERRMYVHFKQKNKKMSSSSARNVLDEISNYTTAYNNITQPIKYPHHDKKVKELLIKIKDTNMSSINPFLLSLLKILEAGKIDNQETVSLLQEVYVLIVRRKIATLPVTKYDTFFPPLLDKIINEPEKIKAFHKLIQKENLWVSDQIFEAAFLMKEIYNNRELNFSRLVLQEIDRSMQKHAEFPDYTTIETIEHILPQTLNSDWENYLGDEKNDINLPIVINTLGNLCLNSNTANSSFGQKSFSEKQKLYTELSALARDVKDNREEPWNISAIKQRTIDLAAKGLEVWKWKI